MPNVSVNIRMASAGCAKRKQCAGVPPPAWLDPAFLEVWGRRPYRVVSARPVEGHRTPSNFFILGAKLAPSSHFFAICLRFLRAMFRSCVFYRFPMVWAWILGGLGRLLGVFWKSFLTRFSKTSIFKKIAFSLEKIDKFKGLSYDKSMKKQ